ncbi:hypothetical protein [Psychromarinibacter halotolerans]|uniref:hypothetical protein n=1 Tax=Psychromarinibacter halotolerans TaxID=1775175 RepID=UPI0036D21E51
MRVSRVETHFKSESGQSHAKLIPGSSKTEMTVKYTQTEELRTARIFAINWGQAPSIAKLQPEDLGAARLMKVGIHIREFCQPLSNFLNRGLPVGQVPLPAIDLTFLALDALAEADARRDGPGWKPVSGRVTVAEGTGALYRRGVWLESGDGRILDLNRADAADGVRVAKAQRSLISEYRAESTLSVRKTSVLLDIWRGTAPGYADFASQDDMQRAYARMKRNVADIMVLGSVRAAS